MGEICPTCNKESWSLREIPSKKKNVFICEKCYKKMCMNFVDYEIKERENKK